MGLPLLVSNHQHLYGTYLVLLSSYIVVVHHDACIAWASLLLGVQLLLFSMEFAFTMGGAGRLACLAIGVASYSGVTTTS